MNHPITRRITAILWAPLLVLVAACGDDTSTGPGTALTGTWSLGTVNGAPLPLTLIDTPEGRLEVLSGGITLRSENRFASRITWRETVNGVATISSDDVVGRFAISGSTLRVTVTGDTQPSRTATLSAGNARITLVEDGVTFEFVRAEAPPAGGG